MTITLHSRDRGPIGTLSHDGQQWRATLDGITIDLGDDHAAMGWVLAHDYLIGDSRPAPNAPPLTPNTARVGHRDTTRGGGP